MNQANVTYVTNNSSNPKPNSQSSMNSERLDEVLKDVVAVVDAKIRQWDMKMCITAELKKLGSKVEERFTPKVTHLVFLGGKRRTYMTALRRNIHIVVPHWISDSKANLRKQQESKYIPDVPPEKEEIPFFRKRKYRPIVKQIVAGTYKPYDEGKGVSENPVLPVNSKDETPRPEVVVTIRKTVKPKAKPDNIEAAPRRNKSIPNAIYEVKREKILDYEPAPENEDHISAKIRELFNNLEEVSSESMTKLVQSCMEVIKSRQEIEDSSDLKKRARKLKGYVPLMDRCRARLEASKRNQGEFTESRPIPISDSQAVKASSSEIKINVCGRIMRNGKRKGDSLERANKKPRFEVCP